jgi:hypothetical protein
MINVGDFRMIIDNSRYAWLNSVIAVGEGHAVASAVEYRVYECIGG